MALRVFLSSRRFFSRATKVLCGKLIAILSRMIHTVAYQLRYRHTVVQAMRHGVPRSAVATDWPFADQEAARSMAHRHSGTARIVPSATRISSSVVRVTIVDSLWPNVTIASR